MRSYNTKARWYEQLTIDEAQEVETLDTIILAANAAKARRYVIQKRALSRLQSRRQRPSDEADAEALVARINLQAACK